MKNCDTIAVADEGKRSESPGVPGPSNPNAAYWYRRWEQERNDRESTVLRHRAARADAAAIMRRVLDHEESSINISPSGQTKHGYAAPVVARYVTCVKDKLPPDLLAEAERIAAGE